LLTLNPIKEVENSEGKIDYIMKMGVTMDHRYLDGSFAAKMANSVIIKL